MTKQQTVAAEPQAHRTTSYVEERWYEWRALTVGAGVAMLAALALIGLAVMHVSRQSTHPSRSPLPPTTRSASTTRKTSAVPSAAPASTRPSPVPLPAPTSVPEFEPSAPPPNTAEPAEATPTSSTDTTTMLVPYPTTTTTPPAGWS